MAKVLEGIRVLDFGRFVACPFAGLIFAQMGAEVIRVERPGGEEDRSMGLVAADGDNFMYKSMCSNKKDITLDITKPEGKEVLKELVKRTDIVMENFSPEAAISLGITYEEMKKIRPDIIFVKVSSFGTTGPYARRLGFDPIGQAMSGAMAITGVPEGPPIRSIVAFVDFSTALSAALGAMFALYHRDKTGKGQMIDVNLMQTAVTYTAWYVAELVVGGRGRTQIGNRSYFVGPSDLYKAKDGWVFLNAVTNALWRRMARIIGREDLLQDPRLHNDLARFDQRDLIDPLVAKWASEHTVAEVVEVTDKARIPCGPCYSLEQVYKDPHVKARKMLVELDFPKVGKVPVAGPHIVLSETPGVVDTPAPALGQHNQEIYGKLMGFSKAKMTELQKKGII